jgi:hypothetical protein
MMDHNDPLLERKFRFFFYHYPEEIASIQSPLTYYLYQKAMIRSTQERVNI